MVNKGYIILGVAVAMVAFGLAAEAYAYGGAQNAEEKVFSIMDRILDMFANFLERIFQSIADAVRSVFTGTGGGTEEASSAASSMAEKAFDFYKVNN